MAEEKNFIDFIVDAQKDEDLLKGFIECQNEAQLEEFFSKRKYQLGNNDYKKLIKAKRELGLNEWPIPPAY